MHINPQNRAAIFSIRALFFGVTTLFVLCLAVLPLVLKDAAHDISLPPSDQVVAFTQDDGAPTTHYTRLHMHIVSLDEVNEQARIHIHGFRSCDTECGAFEERILLFNADKKNDHLEDAIPVSQRIQLPDDPREFNEDINFPMRGSVFFYPFDKYKLAIGAVVERKYPDGKVVILSPEETKGHLFITLEDNVPNANISLLKIIDPQTVKPKRLGYVYAFASQLKFERPTYSVVTVMLVILLSIVMTIFTMFTQPFDKLILNTSALIFGVWSIRSLLLTGYPSDITLLDTVLQAMVVFILMVLAFRSMNFFHRISYMRVLPWAKAPLSKECPYCFTDIKFKAKKCSSCASDLRS